MFTKDNKGYIGEVYCRVFEHYAGGFESVIDIHPFNPELSFVGEFIPFKSSDVEDQVGGYTKIFSNWHLNKHLFYYDDIYKPLRKKIRNRINRKKS